MSDMKCPFCGQELESHNYTSGRFRHTVICVNKDCKLDGVVLPKIIWQELIRTRKALDVAIRGLDQMTWGCDSTDAELLLKEIKEITTLEQKE